MMSHSATVSMFLHINDGPTYELGKVGPDMVYIHQKVKFVTYQAGQSKLAILEITIDGNTRRKAVIVSEYLEGGRIRIRQSI